MQAPVDTPRTLVPVLCEELMLLGHAAVAQRLKEALDGWCVPAASDNPRPRWLLANALVKAADACVEDADGLDPGRDVVRAVLQSVATAARLLTVALRGGQEAVGRRRRRGTSWAPALRAGRHGLHGSSARRLSRARVDQGLLRSSAEALDRRLPAQRRTVGGGRLDTHQDEGAAPARVPRPAPGLVLPQPGRDVACDPGVEAPVPAA
jgi:hypothetical protein